MVNRFSVSVVNRKFEAFQIISKFVATLYRVIEKDGRDLKPL